MMNLWKYISFRVRDSRKYKIFLAVCTVIPGAAGLVLALLWGLAAGITGAQLAENLFINAGYLGLFGFFGGVFYLYNL